MTFIQKLGEIFDRLHNNSVTFQALSDSTVLSQITSCEAGLLLLDGSKLVLDLNLSASDKNPLRVALLKVTADNITRDLQLIAEYTKEALETQVAIQAEHPCPTSS